MREGFITLSDFTPREMEIIPMAAEGKTAPQIALALGIKTGTVKVYLNRVYGKLGFSGAGSRVKLANWVREHANA